MQADSTQGKEAYPYHRRFIRHKVRVLLEVKTNEKYQTWTHNLSEDGICFEIPKRLAEGREVVVLIHLDRSDADHPIRGRCRIVWGEEGKKDFRHGGQFVFFLADGLDRLRQFIVSMDKPLSQPPPP